MPTKSKPQPTTPTPLQSVSAILATLGEAGRRNSADDLAMIQNIHNQAMSLGASCLDDGDETDPNQDDFSRTQPNGATQEAKRTAETKVFQEANLSHGDIASALRSALATLYPKTGDRGPWVWVKDVYDDSVVWTVEAAGGDASKLYQASYAVLDGKVTLGAAREVYVETTYLPVGESKREPLAERKFTQDERDKLAKSGEALSDGSYPIVTAGDLENAVAAYGRSADQATKAHIVKRAKALGATDKLPADWEGSTQKVESAVPLDLAGDLIPLTEGAVRRDGTVALKVINAGWGSSGFYGAEVLKRDGPKAFPKTTKMYVDHPTATQEAERPERSLRDLAAEFTSDARWDDDGAKGPGLYADAKVFGAWKDTLNEMAPHIGVSIRASGTAKNGEAEGRKGKIIEAITAGKSVDFVTQPGRGGEILQLFEAARGGSQTLPPPREQKGSSMDLQEAQAALVEVQKGLAEAKAENARLAEAIVLRDAFEFARGELSKIDLPEISRARIAEGLGREPILKDGKLDQDAFRTKIRETAKVELQYLETATGRGMIRGMGTAKTANATEALERTAKAFRDLGLSESSALSAAKGRAG